jgi:heptosyltransferase-2
MNILIIKIGALGDVVRTSLIAQALRDKYVNRRPVIYWLTAEEAKPLLANNPYIDKIRATNEKEKLRGIDFDLVLNLEEDKENAVFVSSLNYKKLLGVFIKGDEINYSLESKYWFDMSVISKLGKKKADELKKENKKTHQQIFSEIIGIKNYSKYEPVFYLTKSQKKFSENFLRRYNLGKQDLVIGINTGSADRWPKSLSIKKTIELVNSIHKKYPSAKLFLFGGKNEVERNKEISKQSKAPLIVTGCGNDLKEFPALINVCNLFITTDTLGLHLALALKRKVICLIGPTSASELGMYGIGEKIIAKSNCLCCYKGDCKSMDKINIEDILREIESLLKINVTLLITAFKEPKTIGKAIESALNQKTKFPYDIIVSAPDDETLNIAKKYSKKYKQLNVFKDPGKGKSYALNLLFKNIKSDILVLTDGDVYISEDSIESILNLFSDPQIGCITGRPVPIETKKTKYGFWANFLFDSVHRIRKTAFENNSFIECSGYLFAFRKKFIQEIPLDVAEDTVIPYVFWEKGYKIGYAENAKVYVKNVDNWKDWINQKTRTSKAHETLEKYVNTRYTPRVKTFKNESKGIVQALTYSENLKQLFWMFQLVILRLYMWIKVFVDTKIKSKHYADAWKRVESTKQ